MKNEKYDFILEEEVFYSFLSIGNKEIPKVVIFQNIGNEYYNLVLGDIDLSSGDVSDDIISNNGDMAKVLATVFQIAKHFILQHDNCKIILKANSIRKNKLYHRLIENNLKELTNFVYVKTIVNEEIVDFKLGHIHDVIVLIKKI